MELDVPDDLKQAPRPFGRLQVAARRASRLPGLRVLVGISPQAARVFAGLFLVAVIAMVVIEQPDYPFRPSGDTWAYAAAGERLNSGHDLYAVGPGDRPVLLNPPYWTVPLVSPPPVAVVWRPLAAIGPGAWVAWWLAGILATLAMGAWILARGSPLAILWLILGSPALTQATISGNASAYLVPLVFLAWQLRDRAWLVGLVIAAAAAVKLTPILLILWLLRARRFPALVSVVVAGLVILAIALVGAGPAAWLSWLSAAPRDAPAPSSLAGLTGLSTAVVGIAVVALCCAFLLAAKSERLWFSACVVAAVIATPALYFTSLALLAAAASPFVSAGRSAGSDPRSAASKVMSMYSRRRGDASTE